MIFASLDSSLTLSLERLRDLGSFYLTKDCMSVNWVGYNIRLCRFFAVAQQTMIRWRGVARTGAARRREPGEAAGLPHLPGGGGHHAPAHLPSTPPAQLAGR
jgi:hypothetical protein